MSDDDKPTLTATPANGKVCSFCLKADQDLTGPSHNQNVRICGRCAALALVILASGDAAVKDGTLQITDTKGKPHGTRSH